MLAQFPGIFDDMAELLVQFTTVSFFSIVFPLAGAVILANNVLFERRLDAQKLLVLRRGFPNLVSTSLGPWNAAFRAVAVAAIAVNAGILFISRAAAVSPASATTSTSSLLNAPTSSASSSSNANLGAAVSLQGVFIAVLAEHLVFALAGVLSWMLPDTPEEIQFAADHQRYHELRSLEFRRRVAGRRPPAAHPVRPDSPRPRAPEAALPPRREASPRAAGESARPAPSRDDAQSVRNSVSAHSTASSSARSLQHWTAKVLAASRLGRLPGAVGDLGLRPRSRGVVASEERD